MKTGNALVVVSHLHVVLEGHVWAGVHKGAAVSVHQGGNVHPLGATRVAVPSSIHQLLKYHSLSQELVLWLGRRRLTHTRTGTLSQP